LVAKSGGELRGEVGRRGEYYLPGDKSISHRAALLAAMADGESRISNFLVSGVTWAMLRALTGLGINWNLDENILTVYGQGIEGFISPKEPIQCGNSGTTMRLLAGAVAASGVSATLDGSEGLRRRPMNRIVQPLRQMGVEIYALNGCAPLDIKPSVSPLRSIDYSLPVASAQVKSCILIAALSAEGISVIREPAPSRDHTERMLGSMGVSVHRELTDNSESQGEKTYLTTVIPPVPRRLSPLQCSIPGDISAASFLIVAGLIVPNSQLMLRQVGLNPTRTGLIEVLQKMGADIQILELPEEHGEPAGDIVVKSSQLRGTEVSGLSVVRMIDEFPIFSIAAACAQGKTVVRDAVELRHKESDRISALCGELLKLGVRIREEVEGFQIVGGFPIQGGIVQPHGDHRLAMSLAVAGLVAQEPVFIQQAEIIQESFPTFVQLLQQLGADIDLRSAE
jgi:3-phosphoshikimate 1-carboxyvinyltransferase